MITLKDEVLNLRTDGLTEVLKRFIAPKSYTYEVPIHKIIVEVIDELATLSVKSHLTIFMCADVFRGGAVLYGYVDDRWGANYQLWAQ